MANEQTDAVKSNTRVDVAKAGEPILRLSKYTASVELAADSMIEAIPVPEGAIPTRVDIAWSAFGARRTIDVGDGSVLDRFFDGLDVSAAGKATLFQDGAATGFNFQFTEEDTIDIKVLGDTMPADAWIVCNVEYKMAGGIPDESF